MNICHILLQSKIVLYFIHLDTPSFFFDDGMETFNVPTTSLMTSLDSLSEQFVELKVS